MKKLIVFLFCFLPPLSLANGQSLIVHEWGTFTTVHNPDGSQVGRLNKITKSEVLPRFVHTYFPPAADNKPQKQFTKSVHTPGHPDVTMRLETPVVYFYPKGKWIKPFDLTVDFRGGLINEFYPRATPSVRVDYGHIRSKKRAGMKWPGNLDNFLVSKLAWPNLQLVKAAKLPITKLNVWRAPRETKSHFVSINGESEKYLFYRGVAHLEAPISTKHSNDKIEILNSTRFYKFSKKPLRIRSSWYIDVHKNGGAYYYKIDPLSVEGLKKTVLATINLNPNRKYRSKDLKLLRQEMFEALKKEGLYPDEADAMLNTWKDFYFNPGKRLFYVVPKPWVNYHLPMKISVPSNLTRAFIGRIDLID